MKKKSKNKQNKKISMENWNHVISEEAWEAASEKWPEWIGTALVSVSGRPRFVVVVLILSSTVKRIIGSLTWPVKSSLVASFLPSPSHVHLSLSLHLHIKILYFLNQLFVNLFDLLCWHNRMCRLRRGVLFLKYFIDPFSHFIHFIRVHLGISFWNYFV